MDARIPLTLPACPERGTIRETFARSDGLKRAQTTSDRLEGRARREKSRIRHDDCGKTPPCVESKNNGAFAQVTLDSN
jgi:hypothetical protein